MSDKAVFNGVFPIGDVNIQALPVRNLGAAIGYYTAVLGFELLEKSDSSAKLSRDSVIIGLEKNQFDPEQASCYFAVSDVELLHAEYAAKGIEPSDLRIDQHGDKRYRVFFAQEPYGVCFCFGQAA